MKRAMIAATIALAFFSSTVGYAATCDLEKQTIESLSKQLDSIESQLNWAKTNRANTAVQGLGSLIFFYQTARLTRNFQAPDTLGFLVGGAAMAGLSTYNLYIVQSEINMYQEMAAQARKSISDKEAEIRLGVCTSEKVKKSGNQKAKELYETLVKTNKALKTDIDNLDRQLGNVGEKITSTVGVAPTILLMGGLALTKYSREGGAILGAFATYFGAFGVLGNQAINLPSVKMSANEARELLSALKKTQGELLAQEAVLREVLN